MFLTSIAFGCSYMRAGTSYSLHLTDCGNVLFPGHCIDIYTFFLCFHLKEALICTGSAVRAITLGHPSLFDYNQLNQQILSHFCTISGHEVGTTSSFLVLILETLKK